MATISLVILSKKIGIDSTAMALANSSVTSRRWCFLTIRMIRLAYFFSRGFPPLFKTSRLIMSSDSKPIVKPDIKPKNEHQFDNKCTRKVQNKTISKNTAFKQLLMLSISVNRVVSPANRTRMM